MCAATMLRILGELWCTSYLTRKIISFSALPLELWLTVTIAVLLLVFNVLVLVLGSALFDGVARELFACRRRWRDRTMCSDNSDDDDAFGKWHCDEKVCQLIFGWHSVWTVFVKETSSYASFSSASPSLFLFNLVVTISLSAYHT